MQRVICVTDSSRTTTQPCVRRNGHDTGKDDLPLRLAIGAPCAGLAQAKSIYCMGEKAAHGQAHREGGTLISAGLVREVAYRHDLGRLA